MSLDVSLIDMDSVYDEKYLYSGNITHNLGEMARNCGIYEAVWRPHRLNKDYDIPEDDYEAEYEYEDNNTIKAKDIVEVVRKGLKNLQERPNYFKQFDSPNRWGIYEDFVSFLEEYLEALDKYPEAKVKTSR